MVHKFGSSFPNTNRLSPGITNNWPKIWKMLVMQCELKKRKSKENSRILNVTYLENVCITCLYSLFSGSFLAQASIPRDFPYPTSSSSLLLVSPLFLYFCMPLCVIVLITLHSKCLFIDLSVQWDCILLEGKNFDLSVLLSPALNTYL